MEVHHHPHVEKKSFKEYLLEGLMIFLAVSMGFIAENIRENIVQHETVQRNMELIVDNLKEDSVSLGRKIIFYNKMNIILDSLLLLRDMNFKDSGALKTFYSLYDRSGNTSWFHPNNSGLEQMRNTGSIRLVKKKWVLDSLYKYERANHSIEFNGEHDDIVLGKAEELAGDFLVYDLKNPRTFNVEQKRDAINRFHNYYFIIHGNFSLYYIPQIQRQFERAKRLTKLLQEEYHLENK